MFILFAWWNNNILWAQKQCKVYRMIAFFFRWNNFFCTTNNKEKSALKIQCICIQDNMYKVAVFFAIQSNTKMSFTTFNGQQKLQRSKCTKHQKQDESEFLNMNFLDISWYLTSCNTVSVLDETIIYH